jgi:hypothetical protein
MNKVVTWLPVVLVVGLVVAYFVRPRGIDLIGETEFRRPDPPTFEPVTMPAGAGILRGRIVDESGAAVADLPVYARSGDAARWSYTDVDGRFRLDGLIDDELEVLVLALGRPTQSFRARPGFDEVELKLGPPRENAPRLPDVARSDLQGSLTRALEGDDAGCEVLLEPVDPPNVFQGAVPVRAAVDAEGAFRFEGLAHGRYRVKVLPAWARGGSWPDLAAPATNTWIHDGTRPAGVVELGAGALAGKVENQDGSPLAGALVLIHAAGDEAHPFPASVSDATGAFRFADLPAGPFAVEIRAGEDVKSLPAIEVRAGEVAVVDTVRLAVRSAAESPESKP